MQSKFKPKMIDGEEPENIMFATNGTNFSIHPELDPVLMGNDSPSSGKVSAIKKTFGVKKPKPPPKKD